MAGQGLGGMFDGITFWVWFVAFLQGFKCLLIPATLKYADNILYAFAKPASIFLTAAVRASRSIAPPDTAAPSQSFLVYPSSFHLLYCQVSWCSAFECWCHI